jgi:hypothetical protein
MFVVIADCDDGHFQSWAIAAMTDCSGDGLR